MSDEQKILYLSELIKSGGWELVESRLNTIIDDIESKLFGDDHESFVDIPPLEEIELLRRQRKHILFLKQIPNQMLHEAGMNQSSLIEEDYDPYE